MDNQTQRHQVRQQIRQLRRSLSDTQQQVYAVQAAENALKLFDKLTVKNVALYLSFDGELNTRPLIERLWQANINTFLPVLHPFSEGHLLFLEYAQNTRMTQNQFGIEEPVLECDKVLPITGFDVILTPLVAFDECGNRMGMGGGYYDRTLAHLCQSLPYIIGFAHDCQKVEFIPIEPWDHPLNYLVTPQKIYSFL